MEYSSVTHLAYLSASVVSLVFTGILFCPLKRRSLHYSFIIAAGMQSLWLLGVAFLENSPIQAPKTLSLLEALHYCAWIYALSRTLTLYCKRSLPFAYQASVTIASSLIILLNVANIFLGSQAPEQGATSTSALTVYQSIFFSIIALLNVEQLYRNTTHVRLLKIICLNLACVFMFDLFLYSQSILTQKIDADFNQVRATVAIVTSMFMAIAAITFSQNSEERAQLSLSRPIVFYTASLSLAGALLTTIALGGYYVRSFGGDWGEVAYSILLVGAIISITIVFTSTSAREQLNVLINKHLFSHKYDYRVEWLKLIEKLSQPTSHDDVHKRAISAVADIFKCDGGALWLKRGHTMQPAYQYHTHISTNDTIEPTNSAFCEALRESEWVFFPALTHQNEELNQLNQTLPEWVKDVEDIWLIMPLLNERDLIGFMVLTATNSVSTLNWEDLDLLKTVGRQIANYLERHEQAEELAESRQFDAFNKLAAYVMHDLKNLIAQQSLVVENAEKHKDNPAFIDDTIRTISNSVQRMNHLLRKLQRNEPEEVRTLNLQDILRDAVDRCQKSKPAPTLRGDVATPIPVKADHHSLSMVFIHLIQNAQDATEYNGFVDVAISLDKGLATILIEDNGQGMEESFIKHRLFKPFETTKEGKGMGIGVYQARDYLQSIGGSISVESTVDEGTTISIYLPMLN